MINIGILGGSSFAQKRIIPQLIELNKRFNIVGIASRDKQKADKIAENFNTTGFDGYQTLLNVEVLDAIYIPLPNSLHYNWIKKSLQKGLHVLVEKSMACNYAEVKELNELAKEKNLALVEDFHFRFHKQFDWLRKELDSGKIGELREIKTAFGFPPFPDKDNIRYKKELGGGALLDAGAYTIKISQEILGYDINVKASSLNYDKNLGVDIWGGGFLKQNNGNIISHVSFGFDNYYQCRIDLWGSKGKITTNRIFTAHPDHVPIYNVETTDDSKIVELKPDNAYKNMLQYFYEVIDSDSLKREEYKGNVNQSRLISELKKHSS